jgi:hypothetical protein
MAYLHARSNKPHVRWRSIMAYPNLHTALDYQQ